MQKSVGCFTDETLRELAEKPNVTVMQPTHDLIFDPWPTKKVLFIVNNIAQTTKSNIDKEVNIIREICYKKEHVLEFSQKYKMIFEKITTPSFVKVDDNMKVLNKMIFMKAAVDSNMKTENAAKAEIADIALQSVAKRMPQN